MTKQCNLTDELQKDFINTMVETYQYTEESANKLWLKHREEYLDNVFYHITDELQQIGE